MHRKMHVLTFSSLSLSYAQEDSQITGEITSAGMYFLHFQVYRLNPAVNTVCKQYKFI